MSDRVLEFCPPPLVPLADYPGTGGSINGRLCTRIPMPLGLGTTYPCCVPCPVQDWLYPDNFSTIVDAVSYVALASITACIIMLLSFWVLPTTQTHRHYLSVSLVVAVLIMEIPFIIGMATKDKEHKCINEITPYDMASSVPCALSGTFQLLGGWCVVMWVFLRALSLHLQICWQVTPGKPFFIISQIVGWAFPAAMTAIALAVTGVSQRFGNTCHINTKNGLGTFWGPLLAVAAAAIVIQFVTFGYCINVYLRSLFEDAPSTEGGSVSYSNSRISATYTQALRRVKRVIAMQWRGILVVIVVIVDVIVFATVFLQFEGTTEKTPANISRAGEWLECLILNGGDKNKCLSEGEKMVVPEATAAAVLFLLSCNGFWVAIFLGRWSMITGWWHLVRKEKPNDEFVSLSAARPSSFGPNPRTYEDLPSSATNYSATAEEREQYRENYAKGVYEMEYNKQPSILVHESFRPKKSVQIKRALTQPIVPTIGNVKKGSGRPPVVQEDEEMGNIGYTATVTGGYSRPIMSRSVTAPIGLARSNSVQSKNEISSQEQEALELSVASATRGRQNSRPPFPSAHRI
ncbi:hypothetical protein TWF173_010749 [Orbilia oligospora]|uniref:G-protein coupled receptors family 2 profile 2 domain-containing protein n=2 Tax=Orbilia oligospora TaxID=2813651 RepID=G1X4T1_ARTOA|nr:hypothetical protein AOL_s00043g705 [Orbilia oligospora ATCC 24927]EGX51971.1 hypothetical protein AOL_s00043g705 [Orbilia oligospora ATCC 24927]KAF3279458.1 hypothetical protein TWF970_004017 [Orbilia oligospora]KAF3309562.1 hypothetical protein TWF173_010749 [Orbilia oligospora]